MLLLQWVFGKKFNSWMIFLLLNNSVGTAKVDELHPQLEFCVCIAVDCLWLSALLHLSDPSLWR